MKYKLIKDSPFCNWAIGKIETENEWCDLLEHENPCDWPEFFEPIKEPLFRTFDGVEIFDEKYQLIIVLIDKHNIELSICTHTPEIANRCKDSGLYLYFSSKESAETWIEQNKPKFSIQQINDAIEKVESFGINSTVMLTDSFKKELGI